MVTRERGVSGVRRRKRRANHLKQLPVGGSGLLQQVNSL